MKALATRYLNEIVGLAVMALMTVALIAGQADATVHESVRNERATEAARISASLETASETTIIRADLEIQLDLERLIDAAATENSHEALLDLITIKLGRDGNAAE